MVQETVISCRNNSHNSLDIGSRAPLPPNRNREGISTLCLLERHLSFLTMCIDKITFRSYLNYRPTVVIAP